MAAAHALKYNGAPYTQDRTLVHEVPTITSGEGSALCACGELSPVLGNGKARREWFKGHKAANHSTAKDLFTRMEQGDAAAADALLDMGLTTQEEAEEALAKAAPAKEEPAPVTASLQVQLVLGQEVLASTPVEEVQDALAELVSEEAAAAAVVTKAKPRTRKAAKAEPEPAEPNDYSAELPFTESGVVPGFWRSLGRDATAILVDSEFPTVTVVGRNASQHLLFQGPEEDVVAAITATREMWAEAKVRVKEWKTTDEKFLARSAEPAARRQEGYHLTEEFYRAFGEAYVEWRRGA